MHGLRGRWGVGLGGLTVGKSDSGAIPQTGVLGVGGLGDLGPDGR